MDSSSGGQKSSSTSNFVSSFRSKTDLAWAHFKEDVGNDGKRSWTCLHCNNVWRGGGINRMKKHLAGRKGDIASCKKVPYDVRYQMEQSLKAFEEKSMAPISFEDDNIDGPHMTNLEEEMHPPHTQTKRKDKSSFGAASQKGKRKRDEKMPNFFAPRTTVGAQRSIKSVLLRKREGWTEIVRPGPTRFATTFIALKSILEHQHDLQAFFTSKTFKDSRYFKDKKVSVVLAVVLDTRFWCDCTVVVGVAAPLIRMLRIMDTNRRPSIGYVYDGMYRAKKEIKNIFKNKKKFYKPFTSIVKTRWDKQLRRDIHAAAYLLNPAFAFDKFNMYTKKEIMDGFVEMVTSDRSVQRKCIDEVAIYQDRLGSFSRQLVIDSSKSMQPDEWWRVFGCSAPNIQNLAIKILSQTSSSSGCERNWSVFERIQTKKRNRLEHQRLNDLVYVHYNLRLKERLDNQMNCQDPIDYESIDKTDFWVMEEEENSSPILDIDELDEILYGEEALPINLQEEEDKGVGEMQETPSLDLEELLDGGDENDNDYERTLQELDAVWASKDAT